MNSNRPARGYLPGGHLLALSAMMAMAATWMFAEVKELDLAPPDGLIAGCKLMSADSGVTSIQCPAYLGISGENRIQHYYLLNSRLVPRRNDRLLFNKLLNIWLGGNLGVCRSCSSSRLGRAIDQFRASVGADQRKAFLQVLYAVRDSAIWPDGEPEVIYELFVSDISPEFGLHLLNRGIAEHAGTCDPAQVDAEILGSLAVRAPPEALGTFRIVAGCNLSVDFSDQIILAAVGMARRGAFLHSDLILRRVSEFARRQHIDDLEHSVETIRSRLRSLPQDRKKLTDLLETALLLNIY